MSTIHAHRSTLKIFSCLMLVSLISSNIGPIVQVAHAQEAGPTVTPEVTPTAPTNPATSQVTLNPDTPTALPTVAPAFTPTVELTPTKETLSALDLSAAGTGTLFRAQITLKSAHDLERLKGWGIEVLAQDGNQVYVKVSENNLARLARLGFAPTQIDSLDYLVTVNNVLNPQELTSLSELTASSAELMSLSSVDSDNDGLTDTEEAWWCTNPQNPNSDHAGLASDTDPNDGTEVQDILKGITTYGPPFEMWPDFKPYHSDGNCMDGDFDGVPDNAELYMLGTSPQRESSDLDKFDDGQELFGVTFCPGTSGTCGYGILPRAEDAAWISANMPAWVKAPGNSPFVAAFPRPEVEVVSSSLKMTRVTVITTTEGTMQGTEKTYETATTKGASTSVSDTVTWNNWEEISHTSPDLVSSSLAFNSSDIRAQVFGIDDAALLGVAATVMMGSAQLQQGTAAAEEAAMNIGDRKCQKTGFVRDWLMGCNYHRWLYGPPLNTGQTINNITNNNVTNNYVQKTYNVTKCNVSATGQGIASCGNLAVGVHAPSSSETIISQSSTTLSQNVSVGQSGTGYYVNSDSQLILQPQYLGSYPAPVPSTTQSQGKEWGGSQTTTTTKYEEQTISEASTEQFSKNWSTATAVDSTHAADLRFTYNIVNNGTEYAREISSLVFNIYIGSNPNPAHTYCAIGSGEGCQLSPILNLFPGESHTYTAGDVKNYPIALTLDEMHATDEGEPIRIVIEDLSFGPDQAFYSDALNGSVTLGMEDGYDDLNENVDNYIIPVWDPSDTLQDLAKRYFHTIEDANGNLLAIFTPESKSNVPARCVQDTSIAPANNTQVFCKHALTGTSWWNFYLSDGLDYTGAFKDTLAAPGASMLVRIVSDRDMDGYNDRNEIHLGTNPDDAASHPAPDLFAGYIKSCTGNDCTVRMTFQNKGNYDAYGVEAVLYSPDGKVNVTNNTIGGSGRVPAGEKIVVGPSDTFQYTITDGSAVEPVIMVSYNDPQGNHRFILPSGNYPSGALITDLNNDISSLDGKMLPNPGVEIASTSASQANFVINSPHPSTIMNGKLFVEYIDDKGNVLHEEPYSQDFQSGPNVISVPVDLNTYPPATTILLAFFTDSQGNIIDSSARPLASFGPDPLPEANLTVEPWEVGAQGLVNLPNPWVLGTVEPGTTLHATLHLANTGLGDLIYSLTGLGNGVTLGEGSPAGSLGPTQTRTFDLTIDTAGMAAGTFNKTLTLRTSDPTHGTVSINLAGLIATPAGTAYKVNIFQPWNQYVYVAGPHSQNDMVTFTHTLAEDPLRMYPLYFYDELGTTLKGVGEFGVDFSGQTAPFGVFGTGADGDLTVTSGQTIYTDNTRSALAATASSGQANLSLASASGFAVGQEVLLIQVQGSGAGNYEFGTIASVASNILTLNKNITNTYTVGGNSKAQIIRVMQYNNVTVQSGGTITAHAWDGNVGGIVAFLAKGTVSGAGSINLSNKGFLGSTAVPAGNKRGNQGEGTGGVPMVENGNANGNGGGGGDWPGTASGGGGGGSGGNGGAGSNGSGSSPGTGGLNTGTTALTTANLGGGGGGGGCPSNTSGQGLGGNGGGLLFIFAPTQDYSSMTLISSNGGNGGNATNGNGGGGGGGGGAILLKGVTINLGTNKLTATAGSGGSGSQNGGSGGQGRIRIEYGTLTGSTNPAASTQQVNYYNLTGTTPSTLYMPDAVTNGNYVRYLVKYGQRSLNTNGGDQLFTLTIPNRQFASFMLSSLVERVSGSGASFNQCLDIANNATCDWTVSGQAFSGPVQLNSPDLAAAVNAWVTAQHSAAATLALPIRVNLSTPADIFLFNVASASGADVDLQPDTPVLAPQNGNPASNTPEGVLVNVSATIKNNGTHKAENFTVGFYQGDPANGGTLIGSTFIEELAAGATSPVQTVVWNTAGLTPGDYNIYVKADASGVITESDESNNTASASAVVKKKPDLVALSLSLPALRAGESGIATLTVQNDGQADVTGAVVKLYNGTPESGVVLGSATIDVAQGQTVTAQINFSLPNAGQFNLSAKADPADTILEADETNNTQTGTVHIGWNRLSIDAGGNGDANSVADTAYVPKTDITPSSGYGWSNGTAIITCGTAIQQSYRQAGSAESLDYHFDNLLPGRRYHLDLTFVVCSGECWVDIYVNNKKVGDTSGALVNTAPVHVTSQLQTVSILLDPAEYIGGSIVLSLRRASGLSGPVVNIIDLQEVRYCYRDSGPGETPWTAENDCGYDPAAASDGFNGWGAEPEKTIRFSDAGEVKYKFTSLNPSKQYDARLTFYEDDSVGRSERILVDGSLAQTVTLDSTIQPIVVSLPSLALADGSANLSIQRVGTGDSVVSAVTLEENTRAENGRYPAPVFVPPTPVTPTPPPAPAPQVTLANFTASWSGTKIVVNWATTTEINNNTFSLFRSTDASTWTELTPTVNSTRACGNYTAVTPVQYTFNDTTAIQGNQYYYRLQFSGDGCSSASGQVMSLMTAMAIKPCYDLNLGHTGSGSDPVASPVSSSGCSVGYYHAGEKLTLTASPASYFAVGSWSGTENDASTDTSNKVTMPEADHTAIVNYVASTVSISGNTGIGEAELGYLDGVAKTVTADKKGNYSFTVPYNWSGTVTPSKPGVVFTPTNRSYSNITSDQTGQNYTAALLPGTFAKTSPADKASGVSTGPTLTWSMSLGATSYEYCIDTTDNDICDGNLWRSTGAKTNIPLRGLAYAQTYYWQVRATNSIGTTDANAGAWHSFSTQPGAFNKVSPLNRSSASLTPTLSWAASTGATGYEYCIDTTSGSSCDGTWKSVGNGTSIAIGPLSPSTTYYWQVRSIFAGGYSYANNAWWSFTTSNGFPAAFTKSTPTNGSSGRSTSITLTWATSTNATSYQYCIDTTNNNKCDGSWVSTGTETSAAPSGLLNGKTYYWQVQAVNAYGATDANNRIWWSFTIQPGDFTKTTPLNGSKGTGRTRTITWSASDGATSYEYCYDTTANNICDGGKWINAGTARSVTLTFRNGLTYYWQVRAVYSTGSPMTKGYIYADGITAWWKFSILP